MKDGQFYTISGWMGKCLGLRGNDLICFAVIYGFSMDGESQFKGNLDYLTACMFATRPTALLCLSHLVEYHLILKQECIVNGKKRCYYSTNVLYDNGKFFVIDSSKEPLVMTSKEPLLKTSKEPLPQTTKESLPKNYIVYNKEKEENKKSLSNDKQKEGVEFDTFWKLYPQKKSKKDAEKAWSKLSVKDKEKAINKLPAYIADCVAHKRNYQYPATYLNGATFDDDFGDGDMNEEQAEERTVYPDGMTADMWDKVVRWMLGTIRNIAGKISPMDFVLMKEKVKGNSVLMRDILMEIDDICKIHGISDVMSEFDRLLSTDEYASRL